jgi:hypothetical protein
MWDRVYRIPHKRYMSRKSRGGDGRRTCLKNAQFYTFDEI